MNLKNIGNDTETSFETIGTFCIFTQEEFYERCKDLKIDNSELEVCYFENFIALIGRKKNKRIKR